MQNLEQIRAAYALTVAKKTKKAEVSKMPAMILANGLLAAAAFALEKSKEGPKRPGMAEVLEGVAIHLQKPVHGLTVLKDTTNAETMLRALTEKGSSAELQRATSEALAFIGFVKRFAQKDD